MEVLSIKKSSRKHKKYTADVVINGALYRNVNFGDTRYEQYKDSTPVEIRSYSNMDHMDRARRERFLARHRANNGPAALLSKKFLW